MPEIPAFDHADSSTGEAQRRTFPLDPGNLREVDEWIETVGRKWGTSPRTVFRTRLCVAELAANVIEHGGSTPDHDYVIVTLTRLNDGIDVEFLDTGAPFDPTCTVTFERPLSLEAAAIGSRGLMLVRAYTRSLLYTHDGRYNRTTLSIAPG